MRRYTTFAEFWPYYVGEHRNPLTRDLHFIGTTNLFWWLLVALARRSLLIAVLAVVSSYAFAWFGHFVIEKNRPATLDYPLLSALGNLRMYAEIWRGRMAAQVAKHTRDE
jgi:hypothetical protein